MLFFQNFDKSFRKLILSDVDWVQTCIKQDGTSACQYSFAIMFLWQDIYETYYMNFKQCLLRKSSEDEALISYHYPIGNKKQRKSAAEFLIKDAFKKGKKIHFYGMCDETLAELHDINPNLSIEASLVRDNQNYILSSEIISNLETSNYTKHKKYLSRFLENSDWNYEIINNENLCECIDFNKKWYQYQTPSKEKEEELFVTDQALKYLDELKLSGILLRLNQEVIGFEIGEAINSTMFTSHFQKANRDIVGSYQMLYKLFASTFCKQYPYLNIEEDMGEIGMRNAKLSWKPEYLTNYYIATISKRT